MQVAWSEEDMNKFGALGVGSGGFGPLFEVNFLEIIRLFANAWESDQQFLEEGIVAVVEGLEAGIRSRGATVVMNRAVSGLIQEVGTGDSFRLQFDGGQTSQMYDAVIVATTTRSMEFMGMTLDPAGLLEQSAKVALRDLHLMNSSKLFVTTKTKFWYKENNPKQQDLPANMQTDEALRGLYCLNYDMKKDDPTNRQTEGRGVVLVSYVWGDDSTKLLALSAEERFAIFLTAIEEINGDFATLLVAQREDLRIVDWQATANFYGAFKLSYPGQEQACHDGYFQYQTNGGVILAGDSVSWAGGWVEGALTSGVNAACGALAHVGGSPLAESPLTIPTDLYVDENPPQPGGY